MMVAMSTGAILTSSAGVLALLKEPQNELKIFALNRLNELVDEFWAEICEDIELIEQLYESDDFPEKELCALVASKVYYHLGSFQDALMFALGAGEKFDVNGTSEYVETIISQCIDRYTQWRTTGSLGDPGRGGKGIDPHCLESIVDKMFKRCFDDGKYKQAAGIAFETRRIDVLKEAITRSDNIKDMLSYCLGISLTLINTPEFRRTVLSVLVEQYQQLSTPDYIGMCECYIFLNDAESAAHVLEKLARGTKDDALVAYQVAFDMYESAMQHYQRAVQEALKNSLRQAGEALPEVPVENRPETSGQKGVPPAEEGEGMEVDPPQQQQQQQPETSTAAATVSKPRSEWAQRLIVVDEILGGGNTVALHQEFLIRNNRTDLQILKNTKEGSRNYSITHNATIISNGFMHYGTTSDQFLRENLEWLKKASNWSKFSATASMGLIHYGHEKEALNLMSAYLPKDSTSPYVAGGGLYAIGLIHANHGLRVMDYLSQEIKASDNEIVRHGGCLGLGLAAMGTANQDAYELLKENLYTRDDAVIGEAAGLAMGLVMLGTKSATALEHMVNYARETQHEKIQRGLSLGIAMVMYGQLEEAEDLIQDLFKDKDPLLRRAGMFTVAMAYCGSGDNRAIRRLLHVAVSDVDDDVRRAAVMCLGFILFRTPEQCPHVVSLLSESFNAHVRCGSAMALGIGCAGTGNKDALSILEPLLSDPVPFVQQAALVASAMVLIQQTEAMCPKVTFFRQHYAKIISDKHEDLLAKFGAILAQGIIDAGGRNVTISLQSRTGHTHMKTVVGLLVFSQFWFWYPLCHFLSLAFTPAALIALNADLKMPKMEFCSNAKPSMYGYPAPLEKEKEKEREKVATAVLSVVAKANTKRKLKAGASKTAEHSEESKEEPSGDKMDTSELQKDADNKMDTSDVKRDDKDDDLDKGMAAAKPEAKKDGDKKAAEPEPDFLMLSNPARVLPAQLKVITLPEGCHYGPLKLVSVGGIIMLKHLDDSQPEDIMEPVKVAVPGKQEEGEEPLPPEPFEFTEEI